jgi:signal transduction histidine kinase/ActR/RegA family two-component response regulator
MIEIDVAQAHFARESITSLLNRALTPQAILGALSDEQVSRIIPFDYCTLVLPEADGSGIRVWRRTRVTAIERLAAAAEAFAEAHTLLAQALCHGTSRLIEESEMQQHCKGDELGRDARAALALPLSVGGRCFGLICFASMKADIYSKDDTQRLMWLADHVAAVAQGALLREQLESANESVREVTRLKSGFVNTLVRDLRVPLTSVIGLLELFESKLQAREAFDMEDRQLLTNALEQGDRMRQLLDDLLEIAQQHERPLTLDLKNIKVEQLLEDVAEPLRGEAALRGVELDVRVSTHGLTMHVDERQTHRALSHLFTTALAATPDGGCIRIEAQTIAGTRAGDEGRRFVVVNVADSGEGIPAEDVPFVFDAFWRGSTQGAGAGGVGLAIAKRIAAAHGGNVSVRSQHGRGSIFSIILPVNQHEAHRRDARRVLIVDDVPELLLLLRKLVVRMGHQVEIASDAQAALVILREKQIDLLITDWAMPGMNGGELIATLKRSETLRHIPTVVLTGHDTDTERSEATAAGCDRFLVKPVKRDVLQSAISELLTTATTKTIS